MASWPATTARSRRFATHPVTYPPLDLPKLVADDVWIVDSGPMNVYGMPMPIRMTVIRLQSGDLILHSPTRHSPDLQAAIERIGRIRHLLAPNIAHWSFAKVWQRAVDGSILWAAPKLANRRAVRKSRLRIDREMRDNAPAEWRDEIEQILIKGAGFREVALFHRPTATLVLTDTVVNLEPRKLPAPMALLMHLAGASAPHGGAPLYLRALILLKRRQAAGAMRRILALQPARVIFAHGAWFEADGTPRLRRSLRWLLGRP
ncbi:DUF4336 domain-containing protein [Sphingobium yanoikuyae]|uniref:DUF4336 domain-containing protein n=1 Tax=Sphingobium yanoikuyae TaxID=13690 RepID=A0A291MXP7_SPHYA|nr:DUF4336 domain-containing protein [Sphingobium yanoikuyae]ATI79877.1 hypothetical protein A6768_07470 [Sphingobium yanoikuyae]